MSERTELQEIGHSGGQVTFDVKIDEATGKIMYSVGWSHSRPVPAKLFAVYAIPQGVAVADIELGGIGTPWNRPPLPGCFPVFISSDSTGMFGEQCPACRGYWRTERIGRVCPYCATQVGGTFEFLTDAQRRYVSQYCEKLGDALEARQPGKYTIDMDAVADAAGKDCAKPNFYYAEEQQQNLFTCEACGTKNDVLGTFAYCCSCGTRNDLQELQKSAAAIRKRIESDGAYEASAKEAVSAFDSFVSQHAKQLTSMVPLTPARKARLNRTFHHLESTAAVFREAFDIDILTGINDDDIRFGRLMFYRRHVYEHLGGEADEKYIAESGDKVKPKQALRESRESAHRIVNVVLKLGANLHAGFHELFPPLEEPIKWYKQSRGQL